MTRREFDEIANLTITESDIVALLRKVGDEELNEIIDIIENPTSDRKKRNVRRLMNLIKLYSFKSNLYDVSYLEFNTDESDAFKYTLKALITDDVEALADEIVDYILKIEKDEELETKFIEDLIIIFKSEKVSEQFAEAVGAQLNGEIDNLNSNNLKQLLTSIKSILSLKKPGFKEDENISSSKVFKLINDLYRCEKKEIDKITENFDMKKYQNLKEKESFVSDLTQIIMNSVEDISKKYNEAFKLVPKPDYYIDKYASDEFVDDLIIKAFNCPTASIIFNTVLSNWSKDMIKRYMICFSNIFSFFDTRFFEIDFANSKVFSIITSSMQEENDIFKLNDIFSDFFFDFKNNFTNEEKAKCAFDLIIYYFIDSVKKDYLKYLEAEYPNIDVNERLNYCFAIFNNLAKNARLLTSNNEITDFLIEFVNVITSYRVTDSDSDEITKKFIIRGLEIQDEMNKEDIKSPKVFKIEE